MYDQNNPTSGDASTNPFGIDLEDLVETENTALAWMLKQFLKFFLLFLSAATTAAFFFAYAGDAFAAQLGSASPWITALVGALSLDGLSQVWAYLRGHQANTVRQMTTARVMGWIDLLLSLMTTIVYLALTTAFDIGIHAPDGALSPLGQALNITGILVIIMAIGGNFLAYFYYNDNDINNQAAVQRNTLNATINQAHAIINRERLNRTVNQTVAGIFSELPAHTRQAALANKDSYIEQHYGHLKKPPYLNGKLEAIAPAGPDNEEDPTPPPNPRHQDGWATEDTSRPTHPQRFE